jgi:hypothetical protein
MKALAVAAIIASLTVPAYAQDPAASGDPSKEQSNRAAEERKKEEAAIEKAYKDAAKRLPPPPPGAKYDPWGNMRAAPTNSR